MRKDYLLLLKRNAAVGMGRETSGPAPMQALQHGSVLRPRRYMCAWPWALAAALQAAAVAPAAAAVPPLTCTPNIPSNRRTFYAGAWSSTCACVLPVSAKAPCNVSERSGFVCEEFATRGAFPLTLESRPWLASLRTRAPSF